MDIFACNCGASAFDNRGIEPQPGGDRQRVRASWQPNCQPVGRCKRFDIELDRTVLNTGCSVRKGLQLGVVSCSDPQNLQVEQPLNDRTGQRCALDRISTSS